MNDRRRILVSSIFIMAGAVLCATTTAITILYRTAFDEEREYLLEIAKGQACVMEAVARFDAVHSRDAHPNGALVEHLERAKAGEICSVECPVLDTEGCEVWYHTTFVPARDDEGQIKYIIASSVDITERKRAEEELKATLQELERFNRLTVGREERMIELKRQVNEMARKAGIAPPYDTALVEAGQGGAGDV